MKASKKEVIALTLIAILIFVAVILRGGHYVNSIPKNETPEAQNVSPTVIITPTPTVPLVKDIEITPSVKTYTNEKQKFSFNHPSDLSIIKVKDVLATDSAKMVYNGPAQKTKTQNATELTDGYSIEITFISSKKISLDDYVNDARDGSRVECYRGVTVTAVKSTTINNKTTKYFSILNCRGTSTSTEYYINNSGTIVQISTDIAGDTTSKAKYKKIIDSIIDSIKFI
jgi:hypothetical protein